MIQFYPSLQKTKPTLNPTVIATVQTQNAELDAILLIIALHLFPRQLVNFLQTIKEVQTRINTNQKQYIT